MMATTTTATASTALQNITTNTNDEISTRRIVLITLDSSNIILHTFGLYLLAKCYKSQKHERKLQHLLLGNLAAAEIVKNLVYLVLNVFSVLR